MPVMRWDWIWVGLGSAIVGLAMGLAWEKYFGSGLTVLAGAAAGTVTPIAVALYLIHYKQRYDAAQGERFFVEVLNQMVLEALVLNELRTLYDANKLEQNKNKVATQAKILLDELEVFERHVAKSSIGDSRMRRGILRVEKACTESRRAIESAFDEMRAGGAWNVFVSRVSNAGAGVEDVASRILNELCEETPTLGEKELGGRVWAVDHE
ncbi:MAG: hypothetical protein ACKVP3_09220 [Hyphomicrobiaceae bacterium]